MFCIVKRRLFCTVACALLLAFSLHSTMRSHWAPLTANQMESAIGGTGCFELCNWNVSCFQRGLQCSMQSHGKACDYCTGDFMRSECENFYYWPVYCIAGEDNCGDHIYGECGGGHDWDEEFGEPPPIGCYPPSEGQDPEPCPTPRCVDST